MVVIWVGYVIVLYVEVGMGAVDLVHTGSVKGTLECICWVYKVHGGCEGDVVVVLISRDWEGVGLAS